MTELLRCPFCGGEPEMNILYEDDLNEEVIDGVVIRCAKCGISKEKLTPEAAADWWNTRPTVLSTPMGTAPEALTKTLTAFSDFINEPPQYEDKRMVRDYRHELAGKWIPVFEAIQATVLSTSQPERVGSTIEGMTCYERDEILCEDQMCLRVGCRIQNVRIVEELNNGAPQPRRAPASTNATQPASTSNFPNEYLRNSIQRYIFDGAARDISPYDTATNILLFLAAQPALPLRGRKAARDAIMGAARLYTHDHTTAYKITEMAVSALFSASPPERPAVQLQARKIGQDEWIDIYPAQVEAMSKAGHNLRAIEQVATGCGDT